MKQRIPLVVLVLAIVAGLWWVLSGSEADDPSKEEDARAVEEGIDRQAIIDRKMKARQGGEIDLSPSRARGRVTEGQGGPGIPGALVLLTPKGLDQQARATTPGQSADPLQATTDDDGSWSLIGLPAGRYSLSAAAPGYLPATRLDVTLRAGQDNEGLDLALSRGGHTVRGSVSDIGGGPVEDVLVKLVRLDADSPFNFDRAAMGALTDEEGQFEYQLVDGEYSLTTYHPDYVDATKRVRVDGGPRSVDITVTPAGSIEGRVLDRATGDPIEGAIVTRSGESSGGFVVLGLGDDQVMTDAEGRFRMGGLGSGVARLSAVARGYATRQPVEVVLGVAEQVGDVEILVDHALTISGFVVARGDEDRGLEGVLVGAFSFQPSRLHVASGPSASDGYFEIFGVMPGGYTVGAIGEDSLPNLMGSSAQVDDEDVRNVLVVMDAGVHIRGRVSPAVPARVSVRIDAEGMSVSTMMQSISNALVRSRTDEDGTFDLHPVAAGSLTVVAEADDGSRGEVEVEIGDTDLDGLVIDLEPRASVAGRVVDANGGPGDGLSVVFKRRKAPDDDSGVSFDFNGSSSDSETATTDQEGNFVVKGLDAGDYDVTVNARRGQGLEWAEPEDPEKPLDPIEVAVAEGEQRQGLMLAVEARDGVITGVVVGPDGEPVADAWVTALRENATIPWGPRAGRRGASASVEESEEDEEKRDRRMKQFGMNFFAEPPVLTDVAGRFEVRDLRAGDYQLRAEAHGEGARGFLEGVALGTDVRIAMLPLAGLEGIVRFEGKPVVEYTIEVQGTANRSQQIYAPDGRFVMNRLDPGDYDVIARCGDGTARAEVAIAEGVTTSVDLKIGGWSGLRGKVVDAGTGDPIVGLSITVMGDGGPSAGSMMGMVSGLGPKTGEDGSFAVDEVPPGEGSILFFDRDASGLGGGVVAQAEYEVEPEQEQDLGTITGVAPSYIPPEERGQLGITVEVATYADRPRAPEADEDEDEAAFDKRKRLWITMVTPGGQAAQEGLVPGDEILSVDGSGVDGIGAENAAKLLSPRNLRVGDDVALEIEHDGSRSRVTLTAEARSSSDDD